jgi:hypothetical protein
VKKPLKTKQSAVENDEGKLANNVESRTERPIPNFSAPKENAADVQIEEVRLDVAETKSQQERTKQVTGQQGSETPTSKGNTSTLSENLASGKDSTLVNLGRRDKNTKSKIQTGISIDLNSSNQEPSYSISKSDDGMNSPISGENKYSGRGDAAISEDSGGGASNNGLGNALNTIGTTYGKANKQQITQTLPTISDEKDEDIVARQIREAAHLETDQVLKKKLWLEYERYRSGLTD